MMNSRILTFLIILLNLLIFQMQFISKESIAGSGQLSPPSRLFVSSMIFWHSGVTSTIFWIGEKEGPQNGYISNSKSAWDEDWTSHYGGIDDPKNRNGYFPSGFLPNENPFYIALPYNDLDDNGERKDDALFRIPWAMKSHIKEGSLLKDRWVAIKKGNKTAYAQWEDVGPFGEDDWSYVFGPSPPKNMKNQRAGIDCSPAVRDYLGLLDIDKISWKFVDFKDVPPGPWLLIVNGYGQHWFHPTKDSTFYWQLQGEINTAVSADIYDVDLFDTDENVIELLKEQGKRVICYFSAGTVENWRPDANKFFNKEIGKRLQGWEGERWLDIRSENVWDIMAERIRLSSQKGCDGIEPDNVDGYENDTGFDLRYRDQLLFNRFLAETAHKYGLSIGLKNDLEQARELVGYFDFLLTEECFQQGECEKARPFVKSLKPVFDVEYEKGLGDGEKIDDNICNRAKGLGIKVYLMDSDLDGSLYLKCE